MSRFLMPRLHSSPAASIWASRSNFTVQDLYAASDTKNELQVLAPTGGVNVPADALSMMADEIRTLALTTGYPNRGGAEYRQFDIVVAVWLTENWPGYVGEALRSDTWAFLATVLLPDVAAWRFANRTPERLYGQLARNALGRLWLHGSLLQRAENSSWSVRWGLLSNASEDFLLNLVERPSLSSSPEFARAVAEEWLRWRQRIRSSELEHLHRSALKRLRLLVTTVHPAVLDAGQRTELIEEAFQLSYERLRLEQ